MITVTLEKTYGASEATKVRARVSAPTTERAVEIAGPNARVVFLIKAEAFFAARRGCPVTAVEGIDFGAVRADGTDDSVEDSVEESMPRPLPARRARP